MLQRLICAECERAADAEALHWQAHVVDLDDDGEDEVAFFCPNCAAREFDGYRKHEAG